MFDPALLAYELRSLFDRNRRDSLAGWFLET
jgi:hypothetical protein